MSETTIIWQRVEGLAILLLSCFAYYNFGYSWLLFGVLFLAPDVSMVGYLFGNRWGATIYNIFHNYALPVVTGLFGHATKNETLLAVALIWAAHISFDRLLGYGLKRLSGFKDTHLSTIGKS